MVWVRKSRRRFRRRGFGGGKRARIMRARRGAPLNMRRTRRTLPRRQNISVRSHTDSSVEVAIPGAAAGGYLAILNAMDTAVLNAAATTFGNNYRTSTEVYMTGLNLDFTLVNTEATGSECRVMVVYDRQCNGAAMTLAQLLEQSVSTNSVHYNCPLMVESMDRFQVLYDEIFVLPSVNTGSDSHRTVMLKLSHPTQYYQGLNSATVSDISTGSLYLVACSSDYNTTPANGVIFEWCSCLTFMNGNY